VVPAEQVVVVLFVSDLEFIVEPFVVELLDATRAA
jgi:hypothetical protein